MSSNETCYPSDWTVIILSPNYGMPSDAPIVFGYAISFGLFGILFVQTFIYHTRFPNDTLSMKIYVWFVVLLECLSCAIGLYSLWMASEMHCFSCIPFALPNVNISNVDATVAIVIAAQWSWLALAALTGLISFMVHGFFCWRIHVIGKSIYLPIFIMLVSLTQFGLIVVAGNGPLVDDLIYRYLWLGGSLVCDVLITCETIRLLLKRNSASGFKETRSLVVKLIKLTIETGMVTTVAVLLELLLARFLGPTDHLAVYFSISRLYANCLLATLNARLVIARGSSHVQQVSTALFAAPNTSSRSEHIDLPIRRRNSLWTTVPSQSGLVAPSSFEISDDALAPNNIERAETSQHKYLASDSGP
ncbi:hypothetical protein BJ138DRAFT_1161216 [Hygrophoropsis aurantiaca]|uniref:Uncharacterized protein n=1 Tax=Hygrophoropsis aurantiaca TaxID=72124 RepID=A0ACB8A216_9AGAM|nr:hypothetical protein BJ138DRAFT_1161216 [Hygrophoropsis aurantiaca]